MSGLNRRSRRLQGFDYAQAGGYFVTLCSHGRKHLFGVLEDDVFRPTEVGQVVEACWNNLENRFEHVMLGDFVLMPNHLHGIVLLSNPDINVSRPHLLAPGSLSVIVRSFKEASTKQARSAMSGPLWQRNYYDHIIRDEADLARIQTYIRNNPKNWALDELAHPPRHSDPIF